MQSALEPRRSTPGLLVSVRDASEAREALAGGADVIDVKEPSAGPLGAPCPTIVAEVCAAVGGSRPVTVAAGDLDDGALDRVAALAATGVSAVKIGLAGLAASDWAPAVVALRSRTPRRVELVLTAYADAAAAYAPTPEDVFDVAIRLGFRWLLVDTWEKQSGDLFDHRDAPALLHLKRRASDAGVSVVLAGSLSGPAIVQAVGLSPACIGVRGAACPGGRSGRVDRGHVAGVADQIELAVASGARHDRRPNPASPR